MKTIQLLGLLLIASLGLNAQTFAEVSAISGIDHIYDQIGTLGGGCVFFDYDNDGWEDLYIVGGKSRDVLYRNMANGTFEIVPNAGFDITDNFYTTGVVSADVNNDGYRDLFITTWGGRNDGSNLKRNLLFLNSGNGTFTESGLVAGITEVSFSMGASVLDYNKDGFLDIYVVNYIENQDFSEDDQGNVMFSHTCFENYFYENNGDGTFSEKAQILGLDNTGCALAVMPTDFDLDQDQDIYLANDFGAYIEPNALYANNYPQSLYSNVSQLTRTDIEIFAMGIAYADIDKDNDFDYYLTNLGRNVLLRNNGDQTFTDDSTLANVENTYAQDGDGSEFLATGWGTAFLDVNNDTWPDLFVANGKIPSANSISTGEDDPNKLYINNNGITFTDISFESGINDSNRGRGMAYCDYDKDGDLDIVVVVQTHSAGTNARTTLYQNQLNPGSVQGKNWVQFKLEGESINKDAIGAKVKLTVNGEQLIQEVHGQGSHCSQHSLVVHFGLADNEVIDNIEIIWSDDYSQNFEDVTPNQRYWVKEGNNLSTAIYGCTDPNSCNYNPAATVDDGSCQYLAPNDISGNTASGFYKTETYTYNSPADSQVSWTAEGGKIINGQGTNSIQITWDFVEHGRVIALESGNSCSNSEAELIVNLHINNLSEDTSIARIWNEALLEAIRGDYARPTLHARNLFHTSVALYDVWAIFEGTKPYLIGNEVHGFTSDLVEFEPTESIAASKEKAMSYAAYRLLVHRFEDSPSADTSLERFNLIMKQLGYDISNISMDYQSGDAAALGNYVAQTIINYGFTDNSREITGYDNAFYQPVNPALDLNGPDALTGILASSKWQPLTFNTFIDQSGNLIEGSTPEFLSPEWGAVHPFALSDSDKETFNENGNDYTVYHNPEAPPHLSGASASSREQYKWNFELVSLWSSHLDPTDGVMWDISPKSIGNIDINLFPNSYANYHDFYNELEGGDISLGHAINPVTGKAYETQMVPRADYARVLAEFWADGPDSETPPGHWFTILNYVTDHELFERKFNGQGEELSPLEWDVKAYFILAGALHDSAIAAWGIKGWHDYIRPISAIRYMCELGQSTDNNLSNYNPEGIELKVGYIEVVQDGDPLSGINNEHIGKIKLKAWRGHNFIDNATTDVAGVGWILAENWWPYQRPSFVTPPFAGFVSGHSTFSRAAAEVMTLITGDEFFPGGMGEFVAKKDEFLVFEKGPSVDVTLQWATYRDASDQTSLSRIWGGIHPPADDIPGRLIGKQIGIDAYNFALPYFEKSNTSDDEFEIVLYPNPIEDNLYLKNLKGTSTIQLYSINGQLIFNDTISATSGSFDLKALAQGVYILKVTSGSENVNQILIKR
ncbi:hypothetical protein DIS18_13225 [Algibacter marinivivus]|uniref:T9SS type A sorting domain-containing protein n=1 Tax=Algibacter marinivivus TaxID=2100723 RepID=A0A2U2X1J9_9FLAO|nr:FG-GAP-like repeat-containing protein [Algibacter marinivivus]PWH81639.1 hypothetical protein DIS18_13225 [Algibacter marinivivus]